jgi:hypothetical protein
VIYGDTDRYGHNHERLELRQTTWPNAIELWAYRERSLFVCVPGATREQAFKVGREIAEAATKANPWHASLLPVDHFHFHFIYLSLIYLFLLAFYIYIFTYLCNTAGRSRCNSRRSTTRASSSPRRYGRALLGVGNVTDQE